jgi:hypothetical protein
VDARLGVAADLDLPAPGIADRSPPTTSLLENSALEWTGSPDDPPPGWKHWDDPGGRDPAARPTNQVSTGVWREVTAIPGERYAFSVWAKQKSPATHQPGSVELRLENTVGDDQVTLNLSKYEVSKLAGDDWTPLTVCGTTISDKLRVLLILTSDRDALPTVALKQGSLVPQP